MVFNTLPGLWFCSSCWFCRELERGIPQSISVYWKMVFTTKIIKLYTSKPWILRTPSSQLLHPSFQYCRFWMILVYSWQLVQKKRGCESDFFGTTSEFEDWTYLGQVCDFVGPQNPWFQSHHDKIMVCTTLLRSGHTKAELVKGCQPGWMQTKNFPKI